MTRKQIDQAREMRLWLGQVVVPAATLAIGALSIPEVRQAAAAKARLVKQNIEEKLHKKEERP